MASVPQVPLSLSVPLVPSIKAASIYLQRQKRKSPCGILEFIGKRNLRVWKLKGKDALPSEGWSRGTQELGVPWGAGKLVLDENACFIEWKKIKSSSCCQVP